MEQVNGILILNGPHAANMPLVVDILERMLGPRMNAIEIEAYPRLVASIMYQCSESSLNTKQLIQAGVGKVFTKSLDLAQRRLRDIAHQSIAPIMGAYVLGQVASTKVVPGKLNVVIDGGTWHELRDIAAAAHASKTPCLVLQVGKPGAEFRFRFDGSRNYYPPEIVELNNLGHSVIDTSGPEQQIMVELSEILHAIFGISAGHDQFCDLAAEFDGAFTS